MKPKVDEHARSCQEFLDALLPALRYRAESFGYAICVHGSLKRDIDLVAVPWRESAPSAESLVAALMKLCEAVLGVARLRKHYINPALRPHGRKAWAIYLTHLDAGPYLDLSVMPAANESAKTKPNKRKRPA